MFLLRLKMLFFVFSCFVFLKVPLPGIAQNEIAGKKKINENLDFETILAGVKYYDGLVKSATGKVFYTMKQPRFPSEDPNHAMNFSSDIVFDSNNMRLNSLARTYVITPTETWEVVRYKKREPHYYFRTETYMPQPLADPRAWLYIEQSRDLSTYLREKGFYIKSREKLNDIPCYLLEKRKDHEIPSTQNDKRFSRIWISPERGFRYLKYEDQAPLEADVFNSDIKKGTVTIQRITVSYQQHGEVWFPEAGVVEISWLDSDGAEHVIIQQRLETKDFKVNVPIPPDAFTFDIPDDALIKVLGLPQKLSKEEFLKLYKGK